MENSSIDENSLEVTETDETDQYLTFIMDGEEYGVDILAVQEIRGWETATPIPHSPTYMKGVINLRGTIVPIMDLRQRFGLEGIDYTDETVVVILKVESEDANRTMGVVVDAISDVYNIKPQDIKKTGLGENMNKKFIAGLVNVESNMVILLKLDMLLTID